MLATELALAREPVINKKPRPQTGKMNTGSQPTFLAVLYFPDIRVLRHEPSAFTRQPRYKLTSGAFIPIGRFI